MKLLYIYTTYGEVLHNILVQHKKSHNITQHIGVCCTQRTYTQFLQYTTVYFAAYEFILHNFWFHSENQRGHLLLFPCTPSFVQYSIWLKVRVTVATSSTIHSVPSCHTRTIICFKQCIICCLRVCHVLYTFHICCTNY